ncbi:MAG TPA: hypothetical protein VEI99_09370 [Terriglobales bacterium]|nr:hypothetical protein [Terriglobales bacterium]
MRLTIATPQSDQKIGEGQPDEQGHSPIRFTRESHQPFCTAAVTSSKGDRIGSLEISLGRSLRRKEMCAANDTNQESLMPKTAPPKMYSKA